jgi:hypothetical protein
MGPGALPHDGSDPDVVAALRNKHPGAILALYYNWCNRLISAHPRKVMRSEPFNKRLVSAEQPDVIGKIIADIEQGVELTKYLSRRVRVGFELPKNSTKKKLGRLQHLDLLLNEWRIHHFHLDSTVEAHGFVKRGAPLLFAMFLPEKAYLLDIGTRGNFADERLVHIAIETWPDEQLFLEIKGILGPRGETLTRSTIVDNYEELDSQALSRSGTACLCRPAALLQRARPLRLRCGRIMSCAPSRNLKSTRERTRRDHRFYSRARGRYP